MRRALILAGMLCLLMTLPLYAQQNGAPPTDVAALAEGPPSLLSGVLPLSRTDSSTTDGSGASGAAGWDPVWGVVGLRAIPDGLKTAPNGEEYHPNFSLDLDFNFWIWRSQGLYLFCDMSLWGETSENGVTNGRDGFLATSKREYDLSGGAAWNYYGAFEARAFGYTDNNLNRGFNPVTPLGFTDGFGVENRYYLSSEYSKLGQPGFDVTRADFVSIGYFPSKIMTGNDGRNFKPGPMLHAYVTYDLWNLPSYAYGDAMYIGESSWQAKLMLVDLGVATRPFSSWKQWEIRLGVDGTGDFQAHTTQSMWYVSLRFIF